MLFLWLVLLVILPPITQAVYNTTLHPLAKHKGSKLWAAFQFPYVYYIFRGKLPYKVKEMHEKYGPVVRVSPTELSFISAQAWRDIYGAKTPQNAKDLDSYVMAADDHEDKRILMVRSDIKHQQLRNQISHVFSTKSVLDYQPLISGYIGQLISLIRGRIGENRSQDIAAYFNWTTFDIIGDLTFGESFDCLETASYHPWIRVIFDGLAVGHAVNQLNRYGLLWVFKAMMPKSMIKKREETIAFSQDKMKSRIEQGFAQGSRKDFTYFMHRGPERKKDEKMVSDEESERMTDDHMCANGDTLVIAGSETTATLLSGLTFLLLTKRPDYLTRMTSEIRAVFDDENLEAMNLRTVTERAPLLLVALNKALRFYPPVPSGLARKIAQTPKSVDSEIVPVGTSVSVCQWATNHSAHNWHKPDDFLPERWLDNATSFDTLFQRDQKESCQPFSYGPRNCLCKTLGELGSRLIYARLLHNFDMTIDDGQEDWLEKQTPSLIWSKRPLMVRFTDRRND